MASYDIVNDYQWSVSEQPYAREQCPVINLIEFKQNVSNFIRQLRQWGKLIGTAAGGVSEGGVSGAAKATAAAAYRDLYVAQPTGNIYGLPFYSPYHHTVTNSWNQAGGGIGQFVNDYIVEGAKFFQPTAGVEMPKAWQGTSPASYSFTFDLLNTIKPDENIVKNQGFINTLISQNLHTKTSIITQQPPSIYQVEIPGVRYSPVSAITNLTVENVGQVNNMAGQNVPDAYRITIQLTELIVESKDLFGTKPVVLGK